VRQVDVEVEVEVDGRVIGVVVGDGERMLSCLSRSRHLCAITDASHGGMPREAPDFVARHDPPALNAGSAYFF
jgi:hypothetical protein